MSRYKDGRTQVAFRLSDEDKAKLEELAKREEVDKSAMVRLLINRSHRRIK